MPRPVRPAVVAFLPFLILASLAVMPPGSRATADGPAASRPPAAAPAAGPTTAEARPRPPIPAEPIAVVRYRFPRTAKLAALYFARRAGRMQDVPALVDWFGSVQDSFGAPAGVSGFRDIWCVVTAAPPVAGGIGPQPCLLVFLPVGDYDIFLESFKVRAGPDAEGVVRVDVPGRADLMYLARRGEYAVLASAREALAGGGEGWRPFEPGGTVGEVWRRHDVGTYVNLAAARARLGAVLKDDVPPLSADAFLPAAAWMRLAFDGRAFPAARRVSGDVERLAAGVSIDDDGVHAGFAADFLPNSETARRLARVKNTEDTLTAPLPATPCWAAGGWRLPPGEAWALVELLYQSAASVAVDGSDAPRVALVDFGLGRLKPLFAAEEGSFAVLPGDLRHDRALLRGFATLGGPAGDSKTIVAAGREPFERRRPAGPPKDSVWAENSFTPAAYAVDGVSFGKFESELRDSREDANTDQFLDAFKLLYGGSVGGHLGELDTRTALAGVNWDEAETRSAIAAARSRRDAPRVRPGVREVDARLPRARAAVCYVYVDELFRSAVRIGRSLGIVAGPFTLPADLPPMGVTLCVEGRTARVEAYLPAGSVKALHAAFREATEPWRGPPGEL